MKHINLRLPDDLHDKLKAAAENDRRSINSMLIVLIEQAVDRNRPASPIHDNPRPAESYGERKPYTVADRLEDLTGPTTGIVRLPHHINWSGTPVYDLDADRLDEMYTAVLREASTQADLSTWLNQDALIRLWPDLYLPAKVRRLWEDRFPQLASTIPAVSD